MQKNILALAACCLMAVAAFSQTTKKASIALTADSLATGNYKDVLNSFFQLALNRFTGPDKELKFTSSPFAVIARLDTTMLKTDKYIKYRRLRDLNFSFAAKLDTSYKFNGFSSGVKYALINRRDETVSNAFLVMVAEDSVVKELFLLNDSLERYISSLSSQPALQDSVRAQRTRFFRDKKMNFNQLDKEFQKAIKRIAKRDSLVHVLARIEEDPTYNVRKQADEIYEKLKKNFNNRLLWTVGVSDTTYKDQFMFSNVVFTTEAVQGLLNSDHRGNIEYNLKAAYQLVDDTLKAGRDLKRGLLNVEGGFNFILNAKESAKSFLEFKLAGSYYYRSGSLYKNEKRDLLTINGTLRLRVFNDIWVPLEIKYDPKNGNWFGFLNVRANFTAMGGLMKKN